MALPGQGLARLESRVFHVKISARQLLLLLANRRDHKFTGDCLNTQVYLGMHHMRLFFVDEYNFVSYDAENRVSSDE